MMARIIQDKTFWTRFPTMGLTECVVPIIYLTGIGDLFPESLKRFSLRLDFYGCSGITYTVSGNVTNTIAQETPWTWFSWR